jgi:DnaK suppressor protein
MNQTLSPQELREFERTLRALHASASLQADGLQASSLEQTGVERVPFSEEAGEQAAMERELQVIGMEDEIATQARAALLRIEAGTYGSCTDCGQRIERERLRVIPYTARCSACAS